MTSGKTILAVVDPTSEIQPAARRAAWAAGKLGARLELFICDYDAHLAGEHYFDRADVEAARAQLLANHLAKLKALSSKIGRNGLQISIDARWDHPLDEGVIRKAVECGADIVVKDTHYHSAISRSLFAPTDWGLIRDCPAALWLVKPHEMADVPGIIAAVDPVHERAKPADLDNRIIGTARLLTEAVGGELTVFHAFDPSAAYAMSADSIAFPITAPIKVMVEALRSRHQQAVDELAASQGIDRGIVKLLEGDTAQLLVGLAEKQSADIVVVGAVSRNALKRFFLGSTAERMLDRIPCDLLVVRPGGAG